LAGAAPAPGLALPTLGGFAAGGEVRSNVDNVITTTTNTVVDSANSAVSIGRWSNLAIIAFSFRCTFPFPYLTFNLDWLLSDDTSFPSLVQMSVLCETFVPMFDESPLCEFFNLTWSL